MILFFCSKFFGAKENEWKRIYILFFSYSCCKLCKLPSCVGMVPENWFWCIYLLLFLMNDTLSFKKKKKWRRGKKFRFAYSCCSFVKLPNSVGIVPESPLLARDLFWLILCQILLVIKKERKIRIQYSDSLWSWRITINSSLTT